MAEERLKSIIEVEYVGDGMAKYVSDLVRMGAVSEDVGRKLNKALGGKQLLSDMAQLSNMLGNLQNHSVDFNALAGGLAGQLGGASTALRKSIADYESSIARGAQNEMRQTFAMVVALDQAIRRLPRLNSNVQLQALGAGAVSGGSLASNTSQVSITELLKVMRPIEENTAAIRLLTASIRSNGFAADQPVRLGVTERGQYGVIDGSQRILAARAAGYTELPSTLEYAQRARPHFQRDPDLAALVRQLGPILGSSRTLSPGMLSTGTPGEINSRQWFPNALTSGLAQGQYVQAGSRNNNILSDKAPDALFSAVAQLEEQALRGPIERIKRATYGSQGGKPRNRQTESLLDDLNSAAHQIVQGTVLEAKNDALRALPAGRSPVALGAGPLALALGSPIALGAGRSPLALSAGPGPNVLNYQREIEERMLAAGSRGNFAEAERLGSIADYRPNARSGARVPRDPGAEATKLANEVGELEAALGRVETNLKKAAARANAGAKAAEERAFSTNSELAAIRFRDAGLGAGEAEDLPARALSSGRLSRADLTQWMAGRAPGFEASERLSALWGWAPSSGSPLTELDWSGGTHNAKGRKLAGRSETSYEIPGFTTPQNARDELLNEFRAGSKYEAEEQSLRTRLIAVQARLEAVRAEMRAQARRTLGEANRFIGPPGVTALGAGRALPVPTPQVVQGEVLSSRRADGKPDTAGEASRQAFLDRIAAQKRTDREEAERVEREEAELRLRAAQAQRDRAAAAVQEGRRALGAGGGGSFGGGGGPRPPLGGGPPPPDDDDWRRLLEELLGEVRPEASRDLDAAKLKVVGAKARLREVEEKADLPVGTRQGEFDDTKYGFRTEDELVKAVAAAKLAVKNAQKAVAKEFNLLAQGANTLRLSLGQQFDQHRFLEESGVIDPRQRVGLDVAAAKREETLARQSVDKLRGTAFADTDEGQAEYAAAIRRLTQASAQVTRAQNEQKALIEADNAVQRAETASARELAAAQKVAAAEARKQAASAQRVAASSQRTFSQNFMTGFGGRPNADGETRPYAEQLGQAAKFSVFYGAAYQILFAITTTLTATLQESILFEQAMTDLKLATGRTSDEVLALSNELGAYAIDAGFAPSQGVQIGARGVGLYGATQSSAAEQDRVARISAEVVTKLAVGAKKDPTELGGDIAAVTQALGTGVAGQYMVADLDAYMTKRFGAPQGGTLETLAQSGSVGIAAGFSPEQLFAISAQLQSRTNQTPSTVAGYMAQIFSRGGEGSLVDVAKKTGVDSTQQLAGIVEDLAQIYKDADPQRQAEISAAFGRGKVQSAAISLLTDFSEIQRVSSDARGGAADGAADRQFEERMNNLGGQIAQMVGQLKGLAGALGQSGLLDIVGLLVIGITELAKAANSLLSVWNELPNVIQDTILGLAALGLLTKTKTGAGILEAGAGLLGSRTVGARTVAGAIGPDLADGAFVSAKAVSGRTLLSAAARFAAPIGLAVGGLLAVGSLVDTVRKMKAAEEQSDALLKNINLTAGATPSAYDATAAELDAQAKTNRDATGVVAQVLTLGHANDAMLANAKVLEAEATRLRAVADSLRDVDPEAVPLITGFDPDSLSQSLELIASGGGTAETQFRALADALTGSTDAAKKAREAFKPDVLASQFADATITNIDKVPGSEDPFTITKTGQTRQELSGRGYGPSKTVALPDSTLPASDLIPDDFRKTIADKAESFLTRYGIDSFKDLDAELAEDMARVVAAGEFEIIGEEHDLSEAAVDAMREQFVSGFKRQILTQTKDWRKLLRDNKRLTDEELTSVLGGLSTLTQDRLADTPASDLSGRVRIMRQNLKIANVAVSKATSDNLPQAMRTAGQARIALAEAEIARLDAVRRAAQQNATSVREVRAAGRSFVKGAIAAALRGGATDALVGLIASAGDGAIRLARQAINSALAVARAAVALQNQLAGFIGPIEASVAAAMGKGTKAEVKNLEGMLGALQTAVSGGPDSTIMTGSDVPGVVTPPEPGPKKPKKSKEDREAEREAARQEMLDLRNSLYLLSIDLSDPLARAVAAVKDARRRLASDIGSGQSKAQIAGDRVALREAEIAREATAFQQRFDRMQTNEELGRITHRKYMSYLEAEKQRLEAIKNRTYQQQQQLDTVERAMKEAASSMDAMWNFGDIKLPTPYQIRRELTEQTRQQQGSPLNTGSGWGAMADRPATQIYIDGADVGKVRQILSEVLGKGNATVTNRPRRR